jgi:hypothetical protein
VTSPSRAEPAPVPPSLLGLPETDPEICEVRIDVDRLGIVHADLTSEDPRVVEFL